MRKWRIFSGRSPSSGARGNGRAEPEARRRPGLSILLSRGALGAWRDAYRRFCDRLAAVRFRGIVLDYDGTLCYEADRFEPLSAAVARQLNRLLHSGVVLGVATGRGKSVKEALRQAIQPRIKNRVVIGYYNGGDVAPLTDDTRPDGTDGTGAALEPAARRLRAAFGDPKRVKLTFRWPQITIEPGSDALADDLWRSLQHLIHALEVPGVSAVRSSHSIDVVAPGVTKQAVVDRVREFLGGGPDAPILCIGDRGCWPGNDYSLLGGPYSLSVNELLLDPESCWNLAAPGRRDAGAMLDYTADFMKAVQLVT